MSVKSSHATIAIFSRRFFIASRFRMTDSLANFAFQAFQQSVEKALSNEAGRRVVILNVASRKRSEVKNLQTNSRMSVKSSPATIAVFSRRFFIASRFRMTDGLANFAFQVFQRSTESMQEKRKRKRSKHPVFQWAITLPGCRSSHTVQLNHPENPCQQRRIATHSRYAPIRQRRLLFQWQRIQPVQSEQVPYHLPCPLPG